MPERTQSFGLAPQITKINSTGIGKGTSFVSKLVKPSSSFINQEQDAQPKNVGSSTVSDFKQKLL